MAINPPQNISPHFHHIFSTSFLPLAEAGLKSGSPYLCSHGCLDVLHQLKAFTFRGHLDLGEQQPSVGSKGGEDSV